MKHCTMTFFGSEFAADNIPEPFHNYFVVASPWKTANSTVVSIVALTGDSPMPPNATFLHMSGGEDAGLAAARHLLASLPGNAGLQTL
jgi:hypothetical protein